MKNVAIRGRYKPKNKEKYKGDINKITYRSMWERRFMLYCDKSPKIVQWSSEEVHIPYELDGKKRNYYPDFVIKTDTGRHIMVEIKPKWQCSWKMNKEKWRAADQYCKGCGCEFRVLTEKELF